MERSRRGGEWLDAQVRDVIEQQQQQQQQAAAAAAGGAATPFKVHPRYSISKKRKKSADATDAGATEGAADDAAAAAGGGGSGGADAGASAGGGSSSGAGGSGGSEGGGGGGGASEWTTTVTTYGDTHASYEKRAVLEVCRGLKEAICGLPLVRFENAALAHHLPVPGMPSSYELPDGVSTRSS
jgi:hypothetical protein